MNETLHNIFTRRSIRSFTNDRISEADLALIAKSACYAPNARNTERWQFTVVHNREKIRALANAISKELGMDSEYNFYGPDALIIASNSRDNKFGIEDCACALENVFLAAHSLGIGSVWINQLNGICDSLEIRRVLNSLEIPQDHLVWGMAALGYAASPPTRTECKDCVKFIR